MRKQKLVSKGETLRRNTLSDAPTATDKALSEVSDTSPATDETLSETSDSFTANDNLSSEASDTSTAPDRMPSEVSDASTASDKTPSETSDTLSVFGGDEFLAADSSAKVGNTLERVRTTDPHRSGHGRLTVSLYRPNT
ncbi:MAG: hypothetical protein K2N31_02095 [Treponemataceae bacterium]|nr:hypothetical protein [Treponemataceae bacterium]